MALQLTSINAVARAASPWVGGPFTIAFWVKRTATTERRFTSLFSASETAGRRFVLFNTRSEITSGVALEADR